ncbi:MAG: sodium:proton antiporter [Anaerolineae bacterium]|nr:sodium:proton antiporter [Anaerolineae bacterium]
MNAIFAIATGIMFGLGVFQLLRRDLIKSAMGFYILFTAINLLLLAVGAFNGQVAAYVDKNNQIAGQPSDPVVQALLLTAIVISFGSYALLLGFIALSSRRFQTVDSDEIDHLKG